MKVAFPILNHLMVQLIRLKMQKDLGYSIWQKAKITCIINARKAIDLGYSSGIYRVEIELTEIEADQYLQIA